MHFKVSTEIPRGLENMDYKIITQISLTLLLGPLLSTIILPLLERFTALPNLSCLFLNFSSSSPAEESPNLSALAFLFSSSS